MSPEPGLFTAMISSTALDLPEHRAAVKEACIGAGVFPIEMEHFPARDESGINVSLEMVDKADIYLGIYAWRYGWVPDGENISITEMEFDHAVKRKAQNKLREILIFTAHKQHPVTFDDIETGDIPQNKLAAFKTKAATGRVRKEFGSAEELGRLVSDALHEFLRREQAPNARPAPPSTSIRNNLPRLQPFFGRTEELKQIAEALDPESRTWGALIDGPGGMGKTSLAVRAAYDCKPGQFEQIIFVSVQDREMDEDGERTLDNLLVPSFLEMLNEIARELGQAAIAESPEDQRSRLLLEALRPVRALLILDNLESIPKSDRDHLFNFVKRLPQGCKAILTSRRRIGSSSDLLILEKLDEAAALDTLADLARHNPLLAKTSEAERLTLWKQTGGNPLLLRWVAGQIGRGSCRTFTDALHFLSSCPKDNDPLEFIFGDLANEFTREEESALVALTYFALPARVEYIATVAGLGEAVTEIALDTLANRSLVVTDQEETQYALVPMVPEFLRKHRPEVVRETGDRLEQRAYALIIENGYQKPERFPVLEAAWPTVAAALPLFLAGTNDRLERVCGALSRFLFYTGRWDESLGLCTEAEPLARDAADYKEAGWRAYQAAYIHFKRRQFVHFQAWAEKAYKHWSHPSTDLREKAAAVRLHGLGRLLGEDYQAAKDHFEKALRQDRAINPKSRDVEKDLFDLAAAEEGLGETIAAETHRAESRRLAREWDELQGRAFEAGEKSVSALKKKDWKLAETSAQEALTLSRQCWRLDLEASNECRLAQALVRQEKATEALPHADRAVEIYTKLGSPHLDEARKTLEECKD